MTKFASFKIIIFIILLYFLLGPIANFYYQKNYIGPTAIGVEHNHNWLFIHGASQDARTWETIIKKYPQNRAISLANHQGLIQNASPDLMAAQEICHDLSNYKPKKGIVTHSSGSLWLAEAYSKCPYNFKNLQIIMLSPNLGFNINDKDILAGVKKFHYLLPDPILALASINSCQPNDSVEYIECKKEYLYGRLFRMASFAYYNKLLNYSDDPLRLLQLKKLIKEQSVKIFLAENDLILDPIKSKDYFDKLSIKYNVMSEENHQTMTYHVQNWVDFN